MRSQQYKHNSSSAANSGSRYYVIHIEAIKLNTTCTYSATCAIDYQLRMKQSKSLNWREIHNSELYVTEQPKHNKLGNHKDILFTIYENATSIERGFDIDCWLLTQVPEIGRYVNKIGELWQQRETINTSLLKFINSTSLITLLINYSTSLSTSFVYSKELSVPCWALNIHIASYTVLRKAVKSQSKQF